MIKSYKISKKENQKELKLLHDSSYNMYISDDCSEEKNPSFSKPSFHCPECHLIPLLNLKEKDNENIVEIKCCNGHNKEIPLNEFMDKYLQKNSYNIQCFDCGLKLEPKKRFKFCSECVKVFCKNCLKKHSSNLTTANHETISLRKIDKFCCLHNYRYTHYCETCHRNICENCFYLHHNHQILCLKEIKFTRNEIKDMREKLNKENNIINEIVELFEKTLKTLQNKFDNVINHKRQVIEFKKIIEDTYETKDSNFFIIENINRLKFNTKSVKIESEMNELDIIFEIFKYLKCIDYIGLSNTLSNFNVNSNQKNNLTNEESLTCDKYKEKIFINNIFENTFYNNEKNNNFNNNNNVFFYEKKNKNNINKLVSNYNEEEEKNVDDKNDLEKSLLKNNSMIVSNNIGNIKEKTINNELFNEKENINNNGEKKVIKKYSKKITKGKICFNKMNQNNTKKDVSQEEKTKMPYVKIFNEEISFSNENNGKILNKTNEEKNNDIMEYNTKSVNNSLKYSKNPYFVYDEKDREINLSFKTANSIEDNMNINNEFNLINKKLENKKRRRKDSKKSDKKKLLKDKIRENSVDKLIEKLSSKKKDKSKEKRIKIKRENLKQNNINEELNRSFDNVINYTIFDYIYHFKKENQVNTDNTSNIDYSFISEMSEKKNQNYNEFTLNKNKNESKVTNKNNDDYKDNNIDTTNNTSYKILQKEEDNKMENKAKDIDLSINISYINDDKIENNSKTNKLDLDSNISNIIEDKAEKNVIHKDNANKEGINDKSNPENDLSNDDISEDNNNNNEKKKKKKKKKIIKIKKKKKKKIVKIEDTINNESLKIQCPDTQTEDVSSSYTTNQLLKPSSVLSITTQSNQFEESNEPEKNNKINEFIKTKLIQKYKNKRRNLSKSFDLSMNKSMNKSKSNINLLSNVISKDMDKNIDKKKHQRSNSFDISVKEFGLVSKMNAIKFDNGISCLLDLSKNLFAAGNSIGDIKIIDKYTYKEVQTIKEHKGIINSLCKLHDEAILSASGDKLMKKIRLTKNYLEYKVEFIFDGYENYIFKGIELYNNKIISCSWDDKLYLWEENNDGYINTMKFNENQRVDDILEINKNTFCSVSENELKIWDSNSMAQLHSIKLHIGIISQNSLCKLNDKILISLSYNAIHLIDLVNYNLINTIAMDQGYLSCITKLNDDSILIAEDINTDKYCVFYLKQYILSDDELQYISYKRDKFYKTNKNNDKEIRALIQFSDGTICQGISGEFNGKDCGDIYFYE